MKKSTVIAGVALGAALAYGMIFLYGTHGAVSQEPFYRADEPNKEALFEREYALWKEDCSRAAWSADLSVHMASPHYRELVALGPQIMPLLVQKRRDDPDFTFIYFVWSGVTGVVPDPTIYPWARESMEDWWEGGQAQTDRRFEELYAQGDLKALRTLGIAALPKAIEKLRAGDSALLAVVHDLSRKQARNPDGSPALDAASCLAWWEANKRTWTIPFPDTAAKE